MHNENRKYINKEILIKVDSLKFDYNRLYEKLGEHDHAAAAYTDLVMDEFRSVDRTELSHAYKYLTQYHLKREQLDRANHYAQKCLQFDETKEEAKVLLRTISEKRVKVDETSMAVSNKSVKL